jgi:type III pantothenate kinase
MFLAIDCGNTNIVFAVYKNGDHTTWRCKTDSRKTADEYASWLMPLLTHENIAFEDIDSALISSVVPNANFNLERLCTKYFKVTPRFIKSDDVKIDLKIDLPHPETLGADRIVNSVAAKAKYDLPIIIIDFGTATTFDVVNQQGDYCGGVIAPGINLSLDALHNAAAALPKISIEKTPKVIENTTVTAMQSGLYWGYVSMIEGMVDRMADELGDKPTVIATGGLAPIFADGTDKIHHVDGDLTLKGLRLIHSMNSNKDSLKSAA